jgi:hypothetical protein
MRSWKNLKKKLPHNYAVVVAERLTNKGFSTNATYVSDVRRGKIKNIEVVERIWEEIRIVASEHATKTKSLKKIKAV